ncbi:ribose-phosphate diphosphokinase [Candidatus Uhrbacteria bacterium]|nr:ribose-phosphate diphosphokinase [Candidatus Uhrbacteria bacterium]
MFVPYHDGIDSDEGRATVALRRPFVNPAQEAHIMSPELKLFCGRSNVPLAQAIGRELSTLLSRAVSVPCVAKPFNDGEPNVQLTDNVRGAEAFLVQSTHQPGDHLVEFLAMANAAELASAASINAVIPYFGYARQDRKVKPRTPITVQAICRALEAVGIRRLLTTDLHAGQIQGFFRGPFDNLEALPLLLRAIRQELRTDFREVAFVSPDDNGVERCRETGKLVGCGLVTFVMKQRDVEDGTVHTYGVRDPELVKDRDAFLIDDMVDSAASLLKGATALKDAGARRIFAACVHPVLSRDQKTGELACERIARSPIERLYVTDTIPIDHAPGANDPAFREKLRIASTAGLFAGAIKEIHELGSVSAILRRTCEEIMRD